MKSQHFLLFSTLRILKTVHRLRRFADYFLFDAISGLGFVASPTLKLSQRAQRYQTGANAWRDNTETQRQTESGSKTRQRQYAREQQQQRQQQQQRRQRQRRAAASAHGACICVYMCVYVCVCMYTEAASDDVVTATRPLHKLPTANCRRSWRAHGSQHGCETRPVCEQQQQRQ